jgi:phosphoenolpyruvate-protein kinase (PTS system EI component)
MEVAANSLREAGSRQALRVSDLYGVRNRIVALLTGRPAAGVPDPGYRFILLAVDLAPADATELDPARCLAIVTEEGGPTSHTAIIARSAFRPLSRHAARPQSQMAHCCWSTAPPVN